MFKGNTLDGLELTINKLIETGDINENGEINDSAKDLLIKMLETEIKVIVQDKNKSKKNIINLKNKGQTKL